MQTIQKTINLPRYSFSLGVGRYEDLGQPLYARLTVTDNLTDELEEVELTEFLDCFYKWDKEKIIDHLREYRSDWWLYAVEYCEEHLKDYY